MTTSGQKAAIAALDDHAFVSQSRKANNRGRARFAEAIAAFGNHGLKAVPSKANFLLVLFEGRLTAERALAALADGGYAVRHLPGQGLPHGLRITIGTPEQMDAILDILREAAETA